MELLIPLRGVGMLDALLVTGLNDRPCSVGIDDLIDLADLWVTSVDDSPGQGVGFDDGSVALDYCCYYHCSYG